MTPLRATWVGALAIVAVSLIGFLSFVATPVKFLADNVALADLLAVGRVTFRASLVCEAAILLPLAMLARDKLRWMVMAAAAILASQWLGIMPALDARTAAVMAGQTMGPSSLHGWWIAADVMRMLLYATVARLALANR